LLFDVRWLEDRCDFSKMSNVVSFLFITLFQTSAVCLWIVVVHLLVWLHGPFSFITPKIVDYIHIDDEEKIFLWIKLKLYWQQIVLHGKIKFKKKQTNKHIHLKDVL
jgi:hypothetical protein